MKTILLFLLGVISTNLSFGQSNASIRSIKIYGIVKELHTMTPITNAHILVMQGNDTLTSTAADDKGKYAFDLNATEGTSLTLLFHAKHHEKKRISIKIMNDSTVNYKTDVELVYQTVSHVPPRILFERDQLDPIPFDLTLYKQLVEDNPKICLEVVHYKHPEESEKLTKKRLIRFEKFLIESEFPMNQLDFNFSEHETDCHPGFSCHGELFFEITSVEGHCLQE